MLNIAIRSLVKPGDRVVISCMEHNAVVRPLYALGAQVHVAGKRLFDPEQLLEDFDALLTPDTKACIMTHVPMCLAGSFRWNRRRRCAGKEGFRLCWMLPNLRDACVFP